LNSGGTSQEKRGGRIVIFAVIGILSAAVSSAYVYSRCQDPVVEGKRMSQWAFALVHEGYQRDDYWVKKPYMQVFKTNPDAAIVWLMTAVDDHPSKFRGFWFRMVRVLPHNIAKCLLPSPHLNNRWAGVLALSLIARDHPDSRIVPFFVQCMADQSTAVRKVAAYEAGPWLSPKHPEAAVEILRLALADRSPDVRRDACRRIVASALDSAAPYTSAARELLPILSNLRRSGDSFASQATVLLKTPATKQPLELSYR